MAWYDVTSPSWLGDTWREDITAWVDETLAAAGHRRVGDLAPVHMRVWSSVLSAPTTAGDVYFKTTPPGIDFEPALHEHLARRGVNGLRLVGVDLDRNWMLSHGEVATARQVYGASADGLRHWKLLLTRYAQMQIELAADADDLVDAGVPDMRTAQLSAQFDILAACPHLSEGPDGLTAAQRDRLAQLRPEVEALCERLDGFGIAQTLQHNDLHDSNVFVRDGAFVIFDWGDASIAHPFFDGEVLFAVAKGRFGLEPGVEGFEAFRDSYLGPFAERTSMATALAALEASVTLGKLCRAMTWHRIVDMPGGEGAREVVARRAKELLGLLDADAEVVVGPSPYL